MEVLYGVLIVVGSLLSVGVGHWLSDRSAAKQRVFDGQQAEKAREFNAAEAEKARIQAVEDAKVARRLLAYQDVLRAVSEIVNRAPIYHHVVEGAPPTTSAVDLMRMYDWMSGDLGALRNARARAWLDGSTQGVAIVEHIFEKCQAALRVGFDDYKALARDLYDLRMELASVARTESGRTAIDFPDYVGLYDDPRAESAQTQSPEA